MTFIVFFIVITFLLCDRVSFFFIFFLIFYFTLFGAVTVLERKLLSCIGCREGPCIGFKGVSVFFLDFIKFFFKNENYHSYLFVSLFCFFIFTSLLFFLPFSFNGLFVSNGGVVVWILETLFLIFEIFYFSFSRNKFGVLSCFRLKITYLVIEGVGTIMFLPFFFIFSFFDIRSWSEAFSIFSFFEFLLLLPLCFIYFIFMVVSVNRTPFDYFESESELIGGNVVDLGGVSFIIWSLIEYGEVVFRCVVFVSCFFTFSGGCFFFYILVAFFVFVVLFLRALLPRMSFYESMYFLYYRVIVISVFVSSITMAVSFFIYAF